MSSVQEQGFEIRRGLVDQATLNQISEEYLRITKLTGKTNIRHILKNSKALKSIVLEDILLEGVPARFKPVRSLFFNKTKESNWPVPWHQDLTIAVKEKSEVSGYGPWSVKEGIAHVQAPTEILKNMISVRIYMDQADENNGALSVIPNSQLVGKLKQTEVDQFNKESEIVCECNPGDVMLMFPLILHSSKRSLKPKNRRVLHIEYADRSILSNKLEWYE